MLLFGLQGWNFLSYGLDKPGGGVVVAWLICGVLFWIMAAPAVLLMLVPDTWRGFGGWWGVATGVGAIAGIVGAITWWGQLAA